MERVCFTKTCRQGVKHKGKTGDRLVCVTELIMYMFGNRTLGI